MKEEEDAAKEAFDGTTFAQFLFGPGGRQTGAIFLPFGVPRDDSYCAQDRMDRGGEAQTPIGGIHADNTRADLIETHVRCQQRLGKRSIEDMSGRTEREER